MVAEHIIGQEISQKRDFVKKTRFHKKRVDETYFCDIMSIVCVSHRHKK